MNFEQNYFIKTVEGIDIFFTGLYDNDYDFSYMEEEDKQLVINQLKNCDVILFVAKITAKFEGIGLADDYLGGCIYESFEEFINQKDGYFDQMVNQVVKDGKEELKRLKEKFESVKL